MFQPRALNQGRPSWSLLCGGLIATLLLSACGSSSDSRTIASDNDQGETGALGAYSISGQISVRGAAAIDSDSNDPNQQDRAANNSLDTPQTVSQTPVTIVGFVNTPNTGVTDGAQFSSGDTNDTYLMSLRAGQIVELHTRATDVDVDLYIYDDNQQIAGVSNDTGTFDCLRVMRTASHLVSVAVSADQTGAAGYRLVVVPDGSGATCTRSANLQETVITGELIVQSSLNASQAVTKSSPTVIKGSIAPGQRALIQVSGTGFQAGVLTKQAAVAAPVGVPGSKKNAKTVRIEQTVATAKRLTESNRYAHVRLNTKVQLSQVSLPTPVSRLPSNDPDYPSQSWHYGAIDLPGAMRVLSDLSPQPVGRPIVAVIDSGIILDHPDLINVQVQGMDMVRDSAVSGDGNGIDNNPSDESGPLTVPAFHGTHVAGTIAAQTDNGLFGTGVAPMARIMPVRVVDTEGRASFFDILEAIAWSAGLPNNSGAISPEQAADVINLSLGGPDPCMSMEADLIRRVRAKGIVVVGASGNESNFDTLMPVTSPANCPGVLAVGATNYLNEHAVYSNGGAQLDLVGPGGDYSAGTVTTGVASTGGAFVNGTVRPESTFKVGTSMASPHVAGVIALMKFVAPEITPTDIDNLLAAGKLTGDLGPSGWDERFGGGLINARKAVREAIAIASGTAPEPSIIITPRSLSLSEVVPSVQLLLTADTILDDTITEVQSTSPRLTVTPGNVSPTTGLGNYVIGLRVNAPDTGLTEFEFVTIMFSSGATKRVPVSIRAIGSATGDLGPLYVQVIDVRNSTQFDTVIVGQAVILRSVDGIYDYSIPDIPGIDQVSVRARIAPDNVKKGRCTVENWCHQYLQGDSEVLKPNGDLSGVSFELPFALQPHSSQ
jgi:serine protease